MVQKKTNKMTETLKYYHLETLGEKYIKIP